eukprot:jgi/Bigna1/73590/fgenesh1_pg.25_\
MQVFGSVIAISLFLKKLLLRKGDVAPCKHCQRTLVMNGKGFGFPSLTIDINVLNMAYLIHHQRRLMMRRRSYRRRYGSFTDAPSLMWEVRSWRSPRREEGVSTLAMVLNALSVDPGSSLLPPPLRQGLTFDEWNCLAMCNGVKTRGIRASESSVEEFRKYIKEACVEGGEAPTKTSEEIKNRVLAGVAYRLKPPMMRILVFKIWWLLPLGIWPLFCAI